ncbi:MAG: hypothetical protein ABIP03_02835 [Aquihabitans sp.]
MDDLEAWWIDLCRTDPPEVAGLWFGLVELLPGGWHLYVVGTATFDALDETAEWAVGPYAWEPDNRYLALDGMDDTSVAAALEQVAGPVRELRPWRDFGVDGVGVGFDDGDFVLVFIR